MSTHDHDELLHEHGAAHDGAGNRHGSHDLDDHAVGEHAHGRSAFDDEPDDPLEVHDRGDPGFDNSGGEAVMREAASTGFGEASHMGEAVTDAKPGKGKKAKTSSGKSSRLGFNIAVGAFGVLVVGLVVFKLGLVQKYLKKDQPVLASTAPAPQAAAGKISSSSSAAGGLVASSRPGAGVDLMSGASGSSSGPAVPAVSTASAAQSAVASAGLVSDSPSASSPSAPSTVTSSGVVSAAPAAGKPALVADTPAVAAAPVKTDMVSLETPPATAVPAAPAPAVAPAVVATAAPSANAASSAGSTSATAGSAKHARGHRQQAAPAAAVAAVASAPAVAETAPVAVAKPTVVPTEVVSAAPGAHRAPRPTAQAASSSVARASHTRGAPPPQGAVAHRRAPQPMITEERDPRDREVDSVADWKLQGTWPPVGQGQRAWLVNRDGRLITVAIGDTVAGARVTGIERYGRYVRTTAGNITPGN